MNLAPRRPVPLHLDLAMPGTPDHPVNPFGFVLFFLFIVSYFLRLPARVPILGILRLDLVLMGLIMGTILLSREPLGRPGRTEAGRSLSHLMLYIALSLPFVQWPGSVFFENSQIFIKAIAFYVFSVSLITSESRLRRVMGVFIVCQSLRIAEPLYLHLTDGYWGDRTHIGGGEFMARLAGSPYDVINSNGLAFVVTSVLALGHHLIRGGAFGFRLAYYIGLPVMLYVLILTGSRSGMVGLIVIAAAILLTSQKKWRVMIIVGLLTIGILSSLNALESERFLSIVRSDVAFADTARGRIDGIIAGIEVAMGKPFVGHGLGTSFEANFNRLGEAHKAHNLWVEVFQELGVIGLILFVRFLKAVVVDLRISTARLRGTSVSSGFLYHAAQGLQLWLVLNFIWSLASYGLSSYEWYFLGGLSTVTKHFTENAYAASPTPKETAG